VPELKSETDVAIERGKTFWLDNFFLEDGTPKYYDNAVYPIDIHSAAAAIAAMSEMSVSDKRLLSLATKTAGWTLANMRSTEGFFYYQMRKRGAIKTPFMRWGQAWMAYALARLIEARNRTEPTE
jgi:rhamnogalacturonyl hydrolase YesR